jgi:acyl-CoA reductase-like NAD-dependent aldehyde dehydrogenase
MKVVIVDTRAWQYFAPTIIHLNESHRIDSSPVYYTEYSFGPVLTVMTVDHPTLEDAFRIVNRMVISTEMGVPSSRRMEQEHIMN